MSVTVSPVRPLTFLRLAVLAPWSLGGAVLLAILSAALALVPVLLLHRIAVALVADRPDTAAVRALAGLAALAVFGRWVLMSASHALAHAGAFAVLHRLRLQLADRLAVVPMSLLGRHGSGGLRRIVIDDVASMEGFLAHMLPDAAAALVTPPLALALLLAFDWRLGLAALAPLPLAVLLQAWMMRGARVRMEEWHGIQARIAMRMVDYLRGMPVVKLFGLSARSFGDFAAAVEEAVRWVNAYAARLSLGWALFGALLGGGLPLVAGLGAWLHLRGEVDGATLALFLLMAPVVLQPLMRLTFALGEQERRQGALARIAALLTAPAVAERPAAAVPTPVVPRDVAFRDVRFSYEDGRAPVLAGVSFTAKAGAVTALVGPSGAGKSTLLRLLSRHADVRDGALLVAGQDVRDWPADALLAEIGVVFQEVFLFHGTVRDNLLVARDDADEAAMIGAARAARFHEVVLAMPQGYDTPIGERGFRLSGGERQRLSIARALLKDAPILLLDEATSAADAENEALIRQALAALCRGRTVLTVAHRLSSVRRADRIVVLENGAVAGQGIHEELLECCPLYRRLWADHEQAANWRLGGGLHGEGARC